MINKYNNSVVVVDNNYFALKATSELLKEYGYNPIVCKNSGNVMNIIRKNSIDVVLSDISMPDISGIELLERINKFNPDIPVILTTAVAGSQIMIDAINKGAFDFIVKPFKTEYLIKTIKNAVEQVRLKEKGLSHIKTLESDALKRTQETVDALIRMEKMDKEIIQRFSKAARCWINDSIY